MNHLPLRGPDAAIGLSETINCGCLGGSAISCSGTGRVVGISVEDSDEPVDKLELDGVPVTFSWSSCLLTSRTWAAKERYNGVSGALRDTSPRVNSNNGRVVCVMSVG